jgi:hypothetical protein
MQGAETGWPPDDRLRSIKAEGRRRRVNRQRRNATLAGAVAVVMVAVPLTSRLDDQRSGHDVLAARERCVASTEASCGPAHWDPSPRPNEPARANLEGEPSAVEAKAGEAVELRVVWEDPDAPRIEPVAICWGDERCPAPPEPCVNREATGAWAPPQPFPGRGLIRLQHSYASPGSYEVAVVLRSASWDRGGCPPPPGDPYGDEVVVRVAMEVQ